MGKPCNLALPFKQHYCRMKLKGGEETVFITEKALMLILLIIIALRYKH